MPCGKLNSPFNMFVGKTAMQGGNGKALTQNTEVTYDRSLEGSVRQPGDRAAVPDNLGYAGSSGITASEALAVFEFV